MAQNIDGLVANTIQGQVENQNLWYTPDSGIGILPLLVRAGELIPAYWSRARDVELSRYALKVDHVSSAFSMFVSKFCSIPVKIVARDPSIKAHVKQAADLTANINELSNFGKGWAASLAPQMVWSYITQDNDSKLLILVGVIKMLFQFAAYCFLGIFVFGVFLHEVLKFLSELG